MNELNNKMIAGDIFNLLYWFTNHGGITTVNMTFATYYYYKLSNKDKQKEDLMTLVLQVQ